MNSNNDINKNKVLFLHGFNSTRKFVEPLMKTNHHFTIITLDFPGCGENGDEMPISIDNYSEYVLQTITAIDAPLVVVGHSLGGAIANKVSQHPLVQQVILLAPLNPFVAKDNKEQLRKWLLPNDINEAKDSLMHLVFNKEKNIYFSNIDRSAQSFLKRVKEKRQSFMNIVDHEILNDEYISNDLLNAYKHNIKNTVVIQGQKDFFVSLSSAKELSNTFGWKLIELENTGHSLIFERPELITKYINEVISKI